MPLHIHPRLSPAAMGAATPCAAGMGLATPALAVPVSFVTQMQFAPDYCNSLSGAPIHCADVIEPDHAIVTMTLLFAADIDAPYADMEINAPGGNSAMAVIFASAIFAPWGSDGPGDLQGRYTAAPLSGGAGGFELSFASFRSPAGNSPYIEFDEYQDFFSDRYLTLYVAVPAVFGAHWTRVRLDAPVVALLSVGGARAGARVGADARGRAGGADASPAWRRRGATDLGAGIAPAADR
jgi:hypothetical protein